MLDALTGLGLRPLLLAGFVVASAWGWTLVIVLLSKERRPAEAPPPQLVPPVLRPRRHVQEVPVVDGLRDLSLDEAAFDAQQTRVFEQMESEKSR